MIVYAWWWWWCSYRQMGISIGLHFYGSLMNPEANLKLMKSSWSECVSSAMKRDPLRTSYVDPKNSTKYNVQMNIWF